MNRSTPRLIIAVIVLLVATGAGCTDDGAGGDTTPAGTGTGTTSDTGADDGGDVSGDPAGPTTLPSVPAAPTKLIDVATDNYKASFNEDPDTPELRTWLSLKELDQLGVRYRLQDGTVEDGEFLLTDEVPLVAVGDPGGVGPAGTDDAAEDSGSDPDLLVTLGDVSGPVEDATYRIGAQPGRWGLLVTTSGRTELEDEGPIEVCMTFEAGSDDAAAPPLGMLCTEYRWDEDLGNAGPDDLEHNGPGGRWYINDEPTLTNVEAGWE